jgi:hypothetical protein
MWVVHELKPISIACNLLLSDSIPMICNEVHCTDELSSSHQEEFPIREVFPHGDVLISGHAAELMITVFGLDRFK